MWQCGKKNYNKIIFNKLGDNIHLFDFIDNIDLVYSASDLIISRAGALTLSEIHAFGKASILIPFPHSAGNHQYKNALVSKNKKASIIIDQTNLNTGILEKKILKLKTNPQEIKKMEKISLSLSKTDALKNITNHIFTLIDV